MIETIPQRHNPLILRGFLWPCQQTKSSIYITNLKVGPSDNLSNYSTWHWRTTKIIQKAQKRKKKSCKNFSSTFHICELSLMYLVSSLGNESSDLRLYFFLLRSLHNLKIPQAYFLSRYVSIRLYFTSRIISGIVYSRCCSKKVKRVKEKLIECLAGGYAVLYWTFTSLTKRDKKMFFFFLLQI